MIIKRKQIESFLPVFTGFYNTDFEPSEDNVIEQPYNYDNYEFDYVGYRTNVAKACTDIIERELRPLGIKVTYQNIHSPKEYNFRNDSINVKYNLSTNSARLLNKYLLDNIEEFEGYIRDHFKSRDGFISFFSYDVTDWFDKYTKEDLDLTFGTMLDFYLLNEGFDADQLYDAICGNVSLNGWLIDGVQEANDFITAYANDNYNTKEVETIVIELTQHFDKEGIDYDFLTFQYIQTKVNELFNSIGNKTLNLFASIK